MNPSVAQARPLRTDAPKRLPAGPRANRAFTLVELMVVIAIMGLLMAILMPCFGAVVEEARKIQCLSNLRQMALAANRYCQDNGGVYPIAQYVDSTSDATSIIQVQWDFTTHIDRATHKVTAVKPGLLWQSCNPDAVQQCPSYRGSSNSLADPFTGYSYNVSYIGHGQNEAQVTPACLADVRDPSRCILFGDGQYAGGANKFMRSPFPWTGDTFRNRSAGTLGFRHNGAANVVFCDGHAKSFSRICRETTPGEKSKLAANCGFICDDNSLYDLE